MVPLWRTDRRAWLDAGRVPVVHHHCRHSRRPAMLQICRTRLLPVRKGDRLWLRHIFRTRQYHLAAALRTGACDRLCRPRMPLVHHHRRNSVRKAVLQAGQARADALRRQRGVTAGSRCPIHNEKRPQDLSCGRTIYVLIPRYPSCARRSGRRRRPQRYRAFFPCWRYPLAFRASGRSAGPFRSARTRTCSPSPRAPWRRR